MPGLRSLTGFDQGFEAEPLPGSVLPAAVYANWILAYLEAEEVETDPPLVGLERVGQAGFTGLQPQADLS